MPRLVSLSIVLAAAAGLLAAAEPPPTPAMPDGWTVTADVNHTPQDFAPVARNLGGRLSALRNTDFAVNGKAVRVNTIVAATPADADRVMEALRAIKPAEFFVRDGLTIYEFVGKNDAIPEMQAGRRHLQDNAGS